MNNALYLVRQLAEGAPWAIVGMSVRFAVHGILEWGANAEE